jgi:chromosome segregation ATPase
LDRRSAHLDQVRAALDQLRSELNGVHRETLEIRVATEELWIQLSGTVPPAKLTRSLSQARAKLLDDYRSAGRQIEKQREELDTIRGELATEHDHFVRQKEQFENWARQQQQDLEAMAERLVGREQQLDRKEAQMSEQIHTLEVERLELCQEIRRLRKLVPEDRDELIAAGS